MTQQIQRHSAAYISHNLGSVTFIMQIGTGHLLVNDSDSTLGYSDAFPLQLTHYGLLAILNVVPTVPLYRNELYREHPKTYGRSSTTND